MSSQIARTNTWRVRSAAVIRPLVEANACLDDVALKKLISAAYPFGPREHFPYKAWLQEVKYQLKAAVVRRRMKTGAPDFGLFNPNPTAP